MKYVYIDESGEIGRSSKYIVWASIETTKPRQVEKAIKKIWKAKPHLHAAGELHASAVDDATRKRVLLTLTELDLNIRYRLIAKTKQKRPLQDVYYLELANFIVSHKNAHVVVVDKKDTNTKREYTIQHLRLGSIFKRVEFEESYKVKQLQAVDFVAWAIGRFYEQEDPEFMSLIERLIK